MIRLRSPKEDIDLGRIYDIELLEPNTIPSLKEPFVSIATYEGQLVEFSIPDAVRFGKWWEENRSEVLVAFAEQELRNKKGG